MIYQTVLLLFFSVTIVQVTVIPQCGENEVFTCRQPCIETCDYKPSYCVRSCYFGCHCKEGYVRKSNRTGSPCIKREECRQCKRHRIRYCGLNEEFVECANPCPLTCDFWRYPVPKPVKLCKAACRSGCTCKAGYYRSDDWRCVPPEECCRRNEQYTRCGSFCVETCDYKPTYCTRQCVAGCFCKSPYFVRLGNDTNSPCVDRNECSSCEN